MIQKLNDFEKVSNLPDLPIFLQKLFKNLQYVRNVKHASSSLTLLEKPNSCKGLVNEFTDVALLLVIMKMISVQASSRKVSPVTKQGNTATKSKAQGRKIYDVNIQSVYSSLETGVGLSGLKTICMLDVVILIYHTPCEQNTFQQYQQGYT